jgi:DNA-binding MarR family transcriptional regulator
MANLRQSIPMSPAMSRRESKPDLVLGEFLPYLLNRAGVKTGQTFSHDLESFGLILSDWRILIALWQSEHQPLSVIANITVSDLSTMSRQVRALEKAGLIARGRSKSDGRALNLVLTTKGKKMTAQIIPIAKLHESAATQGISEKDLNTVRRCVSQIYQNLVDFDRKRIETKPKLLELDNSGPL